MWSVRGRAADRCRPTSASTAQRIAAFPLTIFGTRRWRSARSASPTASASRCRSFFSTLALAAGCVAGRLFHQPRGRSLIAHGLLIAASAPRRPLRLLMADISRWFVRRRSIRRRAVAASGNYLAGTIWPPVVQHFSASEAGAPPISASDCSAWSPCCRWRCCVAAGDGQRRFAAAEPLRPKRRRHYRSRRRHCRCCCASPASPAAWRCRCRRFTSSPIAAISVTASRTAPRCCPLMLGFGIINRVTSGFIADRIGGVGARC